MSFKELRGLKEDEIRSRAGHDGLWIEFRLFPEICRELWELHICILCSLWKFVTEINRKKIIHGSLRDDTFFISYIIFPEFYLTVKLLCNVLFFHFDVCSFSCQ